ncbi:hypothetical protein HUA74_41210 [Myxococcus sp. CA051A]|uniref:DUF6923 family protein n=1 Tax=unclassified Myxococcus TaxID=2648731 RepID=UPI00157A4D0F|nr:MULTISPECIES: hypothetical protein [unclassified Myxococcus]NTX14734.1 hypothetical protein [Myxococcus sp. CA056]NTX57171.1 hypothetical protein [Myxococcus sp. CA039A]NTX67087.1 hypothetical protein [Myxococcus sp. CA051A]
MNRRWFGVLLGGALWAPGVWAHDFRAEKLVNGVKQATIITYPNTLNFTFSATNIHPTLESILLLAADPLLTACTLDPTPPRTVPVGGNVTYQCSFPVPSYEACIALGALDANPSTPSEEASFTNVFSIGWDSGSAQDGVNVLCAQERILSCDDTVYISTASSSSAGLPVGPSRLYIFDPGTATLALQGETSLPYNALAFNHVDGFLYAISSDGVVQPSFIRVDANGSSDVIAPLATGAANTALWGAGAVLQDGSYLGFEITSNHLVRINTATGATLSDVVVGTPATFRVADFAVNPINGLLYGFNSATQRVTVIDPVLGTHLDFLLPTLINGVPSVGNSMVSAFFTVSGSLFFYGSTNANVNLANTFYSVNLVTGALTTVTTGPATQFADGATCAFNLPPPVGSEEQPPMLTRDHGFYGSSEDALSECLAPGPISLGNLGKVTTTETALGILWANPAISQGGAIRSDFESLKVKVARELLTATCNERFFGTQAPALTGLEAWVAPNPMLLEQALEQLEKHNRSGQRRAVPLSKKIWKMDPLLGQERAVEPQY